MNKIKIILIHILVYIEFCNQKCLKISKQNQKKCCNYDFLDSNF